MKRRFYIFLLTLVSLYGCTEEYNEEVNVGPTLTPRYLAVNPTILTTPSRANKQQVEITSTETPWIFDNDIEWISLTPLSGTASLSATVGVLENPTGDEARIGVFYLKADVTDWSYEEPISVTQSGAEPFISLSATEIEFSGKASMETVSITTNCTWAATTNADWLTVTQGDNSILLSVISNETDSFRIGSVTVIHSGQIPVTKIISVTQAPAKVVASTDTIKFKRTAGSINLIIDSEAKWTASTSNSWIEIAPTAGDAGKDTIAVSVAPNNSTKDRTGYVAISIGGRDGIQIPIFQRGFYVDTKQTELSFKAGSESKDLMVLSNTTWSVSSVPSWITVSPDSGEGDCVVKVTVQDNPNTANRSDIIHIIQNGLSIDVPVTVSQEGKYFNIDKSLLNFNDKEETQTIDIKSDGKWNAQTSNDWITLSPSTGTGTTTLSITVSENNADSERSGQVTISMGDKSESVIVVQKGKFFTIANDGLSFTSKGGTLDITISSNDTWTARIEDNPTWLQLSETSGSGDIKIKATTTDNPSVNSRSATIVFETTHCQIVRLVVKQEARFLTVDNQKVYLYPKGGTTDVITVLTDGDFKISYADTWYAVSQSGNTFKITALENATSDVRTGYINIELTDLKEGTYAIAIPVIQLNYGSSFFRQDFGDDVDYDVSTDGYIANLTIKGFGDDIVFDTTSSISDITLSLSNYKEDLNWDNAVELNIGLTVTVTGYKQDIDYDESSPSTTAIDITSTEYDDDIDWE